MLGLIVGAGPIWINGDADQQNVLVTMNENQRLSVEGRVVNCPACRASAVSAPKNLWDDRCGYPGQFALMRCKNCGHTLLDCVFDPEAGELKMHHEPGSLDIFHPVDLRCLPDSNQSRQGVG